MAKKSSAATKMAAEVRQKPCMAEGAVVEEGAPACKRQKTAKQQQKKRRGLEAATEQPPPVAAAAAAGSGAAPAAGECGSQPSKGRGKKGVSEIDELFGRLQKAKARQGGESAAGEGAEQQDKPVAQAPPKVQGSKDDIFGTEAGKARKRTEEGYAIYSEEELGLGRKGGDTDLCPFDCACCF